MGRIKIYEKRVSIGLDYESNEIVKFLLESQLGKHKWIKSNSDAITFVLKAYTDGEIFKVESLRPEEIEKLKSMDSTMQDPGIGAMNLIEFIETNSDIAERLIEYVSRK